MDYSYGTDISTTCGQCGASLQATAWVIIDTEQRLDLVQALVAGALNSYVCPKCSYRGMLPHAIVIYGALSRYPIIVSSAEDNLPDEAGAIAFYWITLLGEQLGKPANWLDDLVTAGLPIVPRNKIASILQPAAAEPAPRELQEALADLISSKTWLDVYDLVIKQPVLLVPQAEQVLDSLAVSLTQDNRSEDAELFLRRRDFLRSVRGVGIDQAIRDVTGMTINELRVETKLLNWDAVELLEGMRRAGLNPFDSNDQREYLAEHPELAAQLKKSPRGAVTAEAPFELLADLALAAFRSVDEYTISGDIAHLQRAKDSWSLVFQMPSQPAKWLLEATSVSLLLNYATDAIDDDESVVQQLMTIGGRKPVTRTEAVALNNLGCVLIRRFEKSGLLHNLTAATDALGGAGTYFAGNGDSLLERAVQMNLGVARASAYRQSGQIEYLDEAITWLNAAIEVQPSSNYGIEVLLLDGPDPSYLLLLARDLYETKAPDALQILKANVNQSLVTAAIFTTCAALYRERFRHRPILEDLEHFRDLLEQFRDHLEHLGPWAGNSSARRSLLVELGRIYRTRFETIGDAADLDAAITHFDEAIDPIFGYAPGRLRRVGELVDCLLKRYELHGDDADLDRANPALRLALAQTGPESPQRAAPLRWWARCQRLQYQRSRWTADRASAVASYQEAVEVGLKASPGDALAAALDWGRWASSQGSWLEASGAYKHALDALDLLYRRQLFRTSKEVWLTDTQGLASEAAYVIARSGNSAAAVEALERARSRLTSEALARRGAELRQRLDAVSPDLRDRYLSAATHLERLELGVVPRATINDITVARAELDAVLLQLDPDDTMDNKSSGITADKVCKVAQYGTIVYILSAAYGSLALIVRPMSIEPLFLTPHTQDVDKLIGIANNRLSLNGYLSRLEDPRLFPATLSKTLDQLGDWFMTSIAHHLKATEADTVAQSPVVLIPVGRLALFPLHAARCEIGGKTAYFLEHFEVLTAPSASVRAAALAAAERPGPQRLLAIGNPTTDNAMSLHYAEAEAQAVARLFGTHATLLSGLDATESEVEALLPQSGVVHFACHGRFEATNPLESELLLAGETTLRARKVMERSADLFGAVRLVVMSACRTSVTDYLALPDEVLGLSSSFLYAGIPTVVGSLWPVDDAATSRLMIAFYHKLMEYNATPATALRQAQLDALKGTLSSVPQTQFQGAPVLAETRDAFRVQSEPREIASNDPYYWAGFIVSGASEIILV